MSSLVKRESRRWGLVCLVSSLMTGIFVIGAAETAYATPAPVFRVNAGGGVVSGSPDWASDDPSVFAVAGSNVSTVGDTIDLTDSSVPSGTPEALFQSERWDPWGGTELGWDFPVADGTYKVDMYFAEFWSGAFYNGARVFDVSLEDALVLDDYDAYADVGSYKGVVKSFTTTVTDGNIDIDFARVAGDPTIKAIEITAVGGVADVLKAGPAALDVGDVTIGQSGATPVVLSNLGDTGDADITVTGLTVSGVDAAEFSHDFSSAVVLSPGEHVVVEATHTAGAVLGARSAVLTVAHSGTNASVVVSLAANIIPVETTMFRVNAGAGVASGTPDWAADDPSVFAVAGSNVSTVGDTIDLTDSSVPSGTPEALFQSERWDPWGDAELGWDFPVADGMYRIDMYFAEFWSGAFYNGARVFDVSLEGALVLDDYDAYADVGSYKGVVKSFTTTVTDGNIDIDFARVAGDPTIKAIEITAIGGAAEVLVAGPAAAAFGDVGAGNLGTQTVTIANHGDEGEPDIVVASASITGTDSAEFAHDMAAPVTLSPGEYELITVTHTASTTLGAKSATLTLTHDGTNASVAIPLNSNTVYVEATVFRINAGAGVVSGSPDWADDDPSVFAVAGSNVSTVGDTIDLTDSSVPSGTPEALFQSERWDPWGGTELGWDFPVADGTYKVDMYFAEFWSGAFYNGARVFDVSLEDALVLDDYDAYADVGSYKGVVKSFTTTVTDGNIDIDFARVAGDPTIKAIEITSIAGLPDEINDGPAIVAFGDVTATATAIAMMTVANLGETGDPDITITAATVGGVDSAEFAHDLTTPVTLSPGEYELVTVTHTASSVLGVKAATLTLDHSGTNPSTITTLSANTLPMETTLFRVNGGGALVSGSPDWAADGPSTYVNGGSNTSTVTESIDLTDASVPAGTPEALFQSERWDPSGGTDMEWDFPVPPGFYQVDLYFAEFWSGAFYNGARVFDVSLEGTLVLDDYDAYADVGSYKGVVKSFTTTVTDGNIDIDFGHVAGDPTIKAIEITAIDAVLAAPGNLAANPGDGTVSLVWDAVPGADGYRVYRAESAGTPIAIGDITTNAYIDSNVVNGTGYDYTVSTLNVSGEGNQAPTVSATPQVAVLAPPSGLAANAGDAMVALTWNTVSGADGYRVYRAETGGTLVAIGDTTTAAYTDTTATNETTYDYAISTLNPGGEGVISPVIVVTPLPSVLQAPQNIVAADATGSVAVSWAPVGSATGYRVYRATPGGTPVAVADVTGTSFSDATIAAETSYQYSVTTLNAGGESPVSTPAFFGGGNLLLWGGSATFSNPISSPDGSWKLISEGTDIVWRSPDGVAWEKIALPRSYGNLTILDDGTVITQWTVRQGPGNNNRLIRIQRFVNGTWSPVIAVGNGGNFATSQVIAVGVSGTIVIVSSKGALFYSENDGVSWQAGGNVGFGPTHLSAVGSKLHLFSGTTHARWNLVTHAIDISETVTSGLPTGAMYSSPGSTSELWVIGTGSKRLGLAKSTNSGATWENITSTPMPYRSGVTFGWGRMESDGNVHVYGSAVEPGGLVIYEAVWDVAAGAWVTPTRLDPPLPGGSLRLWTTQRADGTVVDTVGWAVRNSAGYRLDEFDLSGGVPNPAGITVQQSISATVLSSVVGDLSAPVWSPDGSWRAIREESAAIWRSPDGTSWERILVPRQFSNMVILNDGSLIVQWMYFDGNILYKRHFVEALVFQGETWYGVVAGGYGGYLAKRSRMGVSASNSPVVVSQAGLVIHSTDGGLTWQSGGDVGLNPDRMTAVGDVIHILDDSGTYARWNTTFKGVEISATPGFPQGAEFFTTASDPGDTYLGVGGAAFSLYAFETEYLDWTSVQSLGFVDAQYLPYGMNSSQFHQSTDDVIRFYSIAECSNARLVYAAEYDMATNTMSEHPIPLYLDETKQAELLGIFDGANNGYPTGTDVWFTVASEGGGTDLLRIGDTLSSPEAVYGFDGYGLTTGGVNAAIGNFVHSETDVAIGGVGPSLDVTRTYNSADRRIGMFGRGWTSTYETRAYENCVTGDVTILHSDGRREFHLSNGSGGYLQPAGYTSTLTKNGSTGWTLEETNGTVREFRTDGRLTSVTDADGQGIMLAWNGSDHLTSVTDGTSGRQLTFTYSGDRVASVSTNPVTIDGVQAPLTWTYQYSGSNLAQVCDARNNDPVTGYCTQYTTTNGVITLITDANGHDDRRISYAGGKVEWEQNGTGDRTSFTYAPYETSITDGRGNTTVSEFDSLHRLTSVTDPLGNETTHEYNAEHFRFRTTDPLGHTTTRTFDAKGNVLSETNGEGETTWFTYDQYNNVIETRDGRSSGSTDNTYVVSSTWDGPSRNRLSHSTPATAQQPSGTTSTWTYSIGTEAAIGGGTVPAGLLIQETDARSNTVTLSYDSIGNLRRTTDLAGLVTDYGYDELGRRIGETSYPTDFPAGVTSSMSLDELGNVTELTGPPATNIVTGEVHQRRVTNTYDPVSNLITLVESDIGGSANPDVSRTTANQYDEADRVLITTNPESGTTETIFDDAGNVAARIDQLGRRHDYSYDERNLLTSEIARLVVVDEGPTPLRDVTLQSVTYDDAGRMVTSADPLGRVTQYAYDQANRSTTVTLLGFADADTNTRNIVLSATSYDAAGNPISVVSGNGLRAETYGIDAAGLVTSATFDPAGLNRSMTITYDENANVVSQSVSDGSVIEESRMSYDVANRVTSQTTENGATDLVSTFEYDNRGVLVATMGPRGNESGATPTDFEVTFEVDELGRTVRAVSPAVDVVVDGVTTSGVQPDTRSGFDTYGRVSHSRDERGNVTVQGFDRLDRVVTITHPTYTTPTSTQITPTELMSYDPVGNLVSRTDRRGEVTTFGFDGLNRPTSQTDPAVGVSAAGVAVSFYDDAGNMITAVDQVGARTEYLFDDLNRVRTAVQVVRDEPSVADRFESSYVYDDLSNPVSLQAPSGDTETRTFSAASELLTATDAELNVTSFSYDVAGRQVGVTGPLGRSTEAVFDLAGRQTQVTQLSPASVVLTTSSSVFDAAGNMTASISPRGHVSGATAADFATTYSYDGLGRLVDVTQPVTGTTSMTSSYGYDRAGNLTSVTNGEGAVTLYGFNEWNLPTETIEPATTAFPNVADRSWVTTYDGAGLPVVSSQPGVTATRSFDELGRVTAESGTGTGVPAASRSFGFDEVGRVIEADSPSGTIGFGYDDRGLLLASTGPTAATASFGYDSNGRMTTRTDASGTATFGWTSRSQLETVVDGLTGTSRTNVFDDAGQLEAVNYSGGGSRALTYDGLGRLTADVMSDDNAAVSASYGYGYNPDSLMTVRSVVLPGNAASGTNTHVYDNAGRLVSWTKPDTTTVAYGWDDAGNLINNAGVAAVFDERNQLLTTGSETYTWSARGTLESVVDGSTVSHSFDALGRAVNTAGVSYAYDSLDRIVTSGSTTFGYGGFEIDPTQIGDLLIGRSPAGSPLAAKQGAASPVLLGRNSHGDIGFQHDAAGVLSATRTYDPLGDVLAETGTLTSLGFQGDYTDPVSGDVWMGARWYRPGTGGFTSRDTVFGQLSTPVSLNRFTYGWANPTGMFDPDGRDPDFVGVKCDDLGDALRVDCIIAKGGVDGVISDNVDDLVDTAGTIVKVVVTTSATVVAAAACGAAAGYVTKNPMAVGAAASGCGGAAGRAANVLVNGGDLGDAVSAATDPRSVTVDVLTGALTGPLAASYAGGASGVKTAGFGALVDTGSGAFADGAIVAAHGGSFQEVVAAAVNPENRLTDAAVGYAIGHVQAKSQASKPATMNHTADGAGSGQRASVDTNALPGTQASGTHTTAGAGRTFTHFTDGAGATGITGVRPAEVGQSAQVGQLTFGKGNNAFLASEPGRIFVTDLGLSATPRQLGGIGVFGSKQHYAIEFSEFDAFTSGARVVGEVPGRGIYSIPGGCTVTGTCTVTRVR